MASVPIRTWEVKIPANGRGSIAPDLLLETRRSHSIDQSTDEHHQRHQEAGGQVPDVDQIDECQGFLSPWELPWFEPGLREDESIRLGAGHQPRRYRQQRSQYG
ncbi:hypothetical protein D3C77_637730 [compost metagenome]